MQYFFLLYFMSQWLWIIVESIYLLDYIFHVSTLKQSKVFTNFLFCCIVKKQIKAKCTCFVSLVYILNPFVRIRGIIDPLNKLLPRYSSTIQIWVTPHTWGSGHLSTHRHVCNCNWEIPQNIWHFVGQCWNIGSKTWFWGQRTLYKSLVSVSM
jgi:hypothetical protein